MCPIVRRTESRAHNEVLAEGRRGKRFRYYLQNFHFQSGGWITDNSASRYDTQVEVLFKDPNATRRQALPPLHDCGHSWQARPRSTAEGRDAGEGGRIRQLENQQALATTTGIRHREDNSAHFWLVYVFTQTRVNRDRMKPSFSLSASSAEAVHI